ncbi:MAG TPA: hypothetical protein GXX17_00420 [Clostridiales bacterium]|nr:hypothetical protein [Clostridiales bacterium]
MLKKVLAVFLCLVLAAGMLIVTADENVVYLSDIPYRSDSTTEYGEIQKDRSVERNPITLNVNGENRTFAKGIGVNAYAVVNYDISEYTSQGFNYFETYVGVDRDVTTGSVTFRIVLDGETVFQTGEMTPDTPARLAQIDITGAKVLTLIADKGWDNICDHADFADARLIKDPGALQKLKSVTVKASRNWIVKGEKVNLSVEGIRVNNQTVDLNKDGSVTYSSSNTNVAAVSGTGQVTGVGDGVAKITVSVMEGEQAIMKSVNLVVGSSDNETSWDVISPNGKIKARFWLQDGTLKYMATYDGKTVIDVSDLGLVTSLGDFTAGLGFKSKTTRKINQEYPMYSGKASVYRDNSNETVLTFAKAGVEFSVAVRAANDSLSFRYLINNTTDFMVTSENTTYTVPEGSDVYSQPYNNHYENLFDHNKIEYLAGNRCLTLLYQTPDDVNVLLSEADMGTNFCGSMIRPLGNNTLKYVFAQDQGTAPVQVTGAFQSPWRVAVIGDLAAIAECQTFENLSKPSRVSETDDDWILPGVTSWTWLTGEGTNNPEVYKKYIDFTAEMGWKYVLMDEGWSIGGRANVSLPGWIDDLVAYADQKGVGLLAWLHMSAVNTPEKADAVLGMISRAGIKGVKMDFFDNENQWTMQLYDMLYNTCQKYKLLVNIHGANKPTGERREYPFCLTREGVQGHEYYNVQAFQNCVLPFTRGTVGPTDYTPKLTHQNVTTNHLAALAVLLESGIPCFASSPEEYRNSALYSWYKDMPAAWDETKLLDAEIGKYVSMARRSGDNWYVSAICVDARNARIDLSFLPEGSQYRAVVYKDSQQKDISDIEILNVKHGDVLNIPMSNAGGCNIKLTKTASGKVGITLDTQEIEMEEGKPATITAVLTGETNGMPIVWKSGNETVATVTGGIKATITPVGIGNTKITATIGTGENAVTATCRVFVNAAPYKLDERWEILNENPLLYSLDSENRVTITTTTGDIYPPHSAYTNLLLTDVQDLNFTVSAKLSFNPSADFQSAGLIVYGSDSSLFSLQRRYHSFFGNHCICGVNRSGNTASEPYVADTAVGRPVYLKIEKTGVTFKGYWSENGTDWRLVCTVTNTGLNTSGLKVGVYTGKGMYQSCEEIPAVIEDFKINDTLIPFAFKNNEPYILGDGDMDGRVTVADVVKLRSIIMGRSQADNIEFAACDVNKDCELTVTDIIGIRRIIMNAD